MRAGLSDVRGQGSGHSFASTLANAGVALQTIQWLRDILIC